MMPALHNFVLGSPHKKAIQLCMEALLVLLCVNKYNESIFYCHFSGIKLESSILRVVSHSTAETVAP